jgi:hypothetical protein
MNSDIWYSARFYPVAIFQFSQGKESSAYGKLSRKKRDGF